ncbi:MAG TPA: hypothetical protein VJG49_00630 [Candidatus Nanoarchaeia archaeon]|nr:hypothetical protein [Candidatus Nanoarchaeia archaeon]
MNKQGVNIVFVVFEILLVLFVVAATIGIARSYGSSETINKINLANEVKLMVNTLVATPDDAVVGYPGNVSKYIFLLNSEEVSVFLPGDAEESKVKRMFSLPDSYQAAGTLQQKDRLCLRKERRNIILEECA